jgi:hypothetical protein
MIEICMRCLISGHISGIYHGIQLLQIPDETSVCSTSVVIVPVNNSRLQVDSVNTSLTVCDSEMGSSVTVPASLRLQGYSLTSKTSNRRRRQLPARPASGPAGLLGPIQVTSTTSTEYD